jgi:nucleoside-triphosphatase THEP1
MKILLTGKNRSGKTTLLAALLAEANDKLGFMTNEVREDGERIGFDMVDSQGRTAPLARTNRPTAYPVGRYL